MNSIQYEYNGGQDHFQYKGRYSDFTNEVRNKYPSSRKDHTAICHRVSFYLMAKGLMNPCNCFLDALAQNRITDNLPNETIYYITGMVVAVSGLCWDNFMEVVTVYNADKNYFNTINMLEWIEENFAGSDDPAESQKLEQYKFLLNNIGRILKDVGNFGSEIDAMLIIEGLLNRILDNLNNEFHNLSLGNASWNSSLGNAFDPFAPVVSNGNEFIIIDDDDNGADDGKVITILKHATLGGGQNYNESELFIYTAEYEGRNFVYQSCIMDIPLESVSFVKCEKPIIYHDYLRENDIPFYEE